MTEEYEAKRYAIERDLENWCEKYGCNAEEIDFNGYVDISPSTVMGHCIYRDRHLCVIELDIKWKKRKYGYLERSVLWHELCHARAYLEDGVSDAHNDHFKEYLKQEPMLYVGDILAKFVWFFL